MPNVKFNLKEPKSESETLILMYFHFEGKRLRYSTQEKIHPDNWNSSENRVRRIKGISHDEINSWLDKLETYIKGIYRSFKTDNIPVSSKLLKEELDIKTERKKHELNDFFSFANKHINSLKRLNKSYKSTQSTVNLLQEFDYKLDFEDIDVNFYRKFTTYMNNKTYVSGTNEYGEKEYKNYSKNYIGKTIGNIKAIMNEAVEQGATSNLKFRSKKFKSESENVYNVYLNVDELKKLHHHKFSKGYLEKAVDRFLIGAFTGMRFSDYNRLNEVNFEGGEFIIQDTQKVAGRVIIPKHWIIDEIVQKYKGKLPGPISNQKLNKYLKVACKEARLNTKIMQTRTEGGKKVSRTYEKWELVKTHTARRSLATNMYLEGFPDRFIMMLTGHKTVTQLHKYIKVTELEIAMNIQNHPFFKKPKNTD